MTREAVAGRALPYSDSMLLACSRRCGGKLFRALFAEVELEADGTYVDHQIAQPGYVCLNCGAPAFDLGQVPAEMTAEADEHTPKTSDIPFPVSQTLVQAH